MTRQGGHALTTESLRQHTLEAEGSDTDAASPEMFQYFDSGRQTEVGGVEGAVGIMKLEDRLGHAGWDTGRNGAWPMLVVW